MRRIVGLKMRRLVPSMIWFIEWGIKARHAHLVFKCAQAVGFDIEFEIQCTEIFSRYLVRLARYNSHSHCCTMPVGSLDKVSSLRIPVDRFTGLISLSSGKVGEQERIPSDQSQASLGC